MSKGKGVEAYTLIVVEHGGDKEVLNELMQLKSITEASLIYGKYDIHCKINVTSMDDLKEVIGEIRKLKVITTETFIAYEKAQIGGSLGNNYIRRLGRTRARR